MQYKNLSMFKYQMLCKLIVPVALNHVTSRKVQVKALPNDFYQKIARLNQEDKELYQIKMKQQILTAIPDQYKSIVEDFDIETLEAIDYIRVMFTPPLDASRKIRLRKEIVRIIENTYKQWSVKELDFFVDLLKSYDCYK